MAMIPPILTFWEFTWRKEGADHWVDIEKTAEHVSEAVTNHENRSVDWEKKRLESEEMSLELQRLVGM